jgi:spermidine/putrescine-binding protein
MLLGLSAAPLLTAEPNLIAKLDPANIPNLQNIPEKFRQEYPYGIPTDYGKIGYAYRQDLIPERPTTWAEVWDLAPKYSGKVVLLDGEEDCMGNVLLMLGYSGNSTNPDEITAAKNKLLEIKPHLMAFLGTDVMKPLIKGTAVITMDYDFDIALAHQQDPNIVWVVPEEGLMAYLEGWVGIEKTELLPEVEAFMNFHLDPVNYADFVNTTGTAYIMPAATPHVKKSIATDPILAFEPTTVSRLEFEKFKGADATKLWADAWAEVHAA